VRLFVALDIPETVRDSLSTLSRQLQKVYPGARWVHLDRAHLTIKFIGETPVDRAERIRSLLDTMPATGPIELCFAGLGYFPNARRPRVLWAGIESSEELRALAASVEARLEPLDIPREEREFQPHITLARFDNPKGIEPLRAAVEALGRPEFGRTRAEEFYLYQSVLKRGGAEYTRLASFRLSREPAS
jgi:2'-5' RNA ligase